MYGLVHLRAPHDGAKRLVESTRSLCGEFRSDFVGDARILALLSHEWDNQAGQFVETAEREWLFPLSISMGDGVVIR